MDKSNVKWVNVICGPVVFHRNSSVKYSCGHYKYCITGDVCVRIRNSNQNTYFFYFVTDVGTDDQWQFTEFGLAGVAEW